MPNDFVQSVVLLIKGAIKDEKVILPGAFELSEDIITLAKRHYIFNVLLYGVQAAGLDMKNDVAHKLLMGASREIILNENQTLELKSICDAFKKNGIDFMLLKGSVIKQRYPRPEMRVMGDADILIRTQQYPQIAEIMKQLGFDEGIESNHEYIWNKKGFLHLELHKMLIPSYNKDYYNYFKDGWDFAQKKEKNTEYILNPDDEFIYLFTHFAKHYRDGGIGIKHVIDLWVTRSSSRLNEDYIVKELRKLGLDEFYSNILNVLEVWFNGKEWDEKSQFITSVIFDSGAFGTYTAYLNAHALKFSSFKERGKSGKLSFIIKKIFPPRRTLEGHYSYLEKAPFLLPLAWISRIFGLIFKTQRISKNLKDIKMVTDESISEYEKSLHYVGLDFNFKE